MHMPVHALQYPEVMLPRQLQLRQQPVGLGVVAIAQRAAAHALGVGFSPQPLIQSCAKEAVAGPATQARGLWGSVDPGFSHIYWARRMTPPFSMSPEPIAIGRDRAS